MSKPQIFTLMGPTASGKTATAMHLAEQHGFELISVDSVLVYRGLDIASAKPTPAELAAVPHALVNICDFWETYSAGQFREDCHEQIQGILARGHKPLLVGGSQLYFKTLFTLNSELPSQDSELRLRLRAQAQTLGWPEMHRRLAAVDPITAARLHPNHNTRIERALEVFELTGRPLSDFHVTQQSDYRIHSMAIVPSQRSWLHQRIQQRFDQMIELGLLDEVQGLMRHPRFDASLPALNSVGYRQAIAGIQAGESPDQWIPKAVAATRQLAKRQLTWLRSWPDLVELPAETMSPDKALSALSDFI